MKTRRSLLLLLTLVLVVGGTGGLWVWQAKRQYALNRQLVTALVHNDTKTALALVNAGADPNTRYTPLPAPTVKLLLNQMLHRAPPPANDSSTAFMFVCCAAWYEEGNHIRIALRSPEDVYLVRAMLIHGADCNLTSSSQNWSALHCATWAHRPKTVQLLLEHGANINQQDTIGSTSLMQAVIHSDVEVTRLLLDHGANVSLESSGDDTALHIAMAHRIDKNIIDLLLAHGADPNHADKNGNTPIMLAQKIDRPDIVALLRRKR